MSLIGLFARFDGRIGRRSWWTGALLLLVAGIAGSYLIDPEAFGPDRQESPPFHLGRAAWAALLIWPTCAVTLKRLNDRDQPAWVGRAFIALSLALFAVSELGAVGDPSQSGGLVLAALFAAALFHAWVFIDNGFLAGTPGPNRHGPDPLAPVAAGGPDAAPAVSRSGRTWGANVRDGLVGLLCLVFGLVWAGRHPGAEVSFKSLLNVLLMPNALQLEIDRRANQPAWKALGAGRVAARSGDHETALAHFSRSIALYGETQATAAEAYVRRARSLRRLGRLAALADNDRAVALDPETAGYHASRARTLRALGRHDQVLAAYDRALQLKPDDPDHHIGRGYTLGRLGRQKEAVAAFSKAIAAAAHERADHAQRLKDWAPGRGLKKEILLAWQAGARETMADAYRRRGNALGDLGRIDAAMTDYGKAIEIGKAPDDAHVSRGNLHRDRSDADKALADYAQALRINPQNLQAYRNRGWLYETQGRWTLALADYERAAERSEPDAWLTRALARMRARLR